MKRGITSPHSGKAIRSAFWRQQRQPDRRCAPYLPSVGPEYGPYAARTDGRVAVKVRGWPVRGDLQPPMQALLTPPPPLAPQHRRPLVPQHRRPQARRPQVQREAAGSILASSDRP